MHCLVTGASGFIGRVLCAELVRRGHRVTGLFRNQVDGPWDKGCQFDLGSDPLPKDLCAGIDVVYHLAGIAHDLKKTQYEEADYFRVNTQASVDLVRLAGLSGVKHFVYFSSVKAVADPGDQCVDERWDAYPADVYGVSKRKAEELLLSMHDVSQCAVTILRPALVYGPGIKGNLKKMVQAIGSGFFPPLPETGNRRSLIHVRDLVDIAQRITLHHLAYGQTYIVSEQVPYSTRKMYEIICRALDKPASKWAIPEAVLRGMAKVGDGVEWLTGRHCFVNSSMMDRLLGSACYQSDLVREVFSWEPLRTLGGSVREE